MIDPNNRRYFICITKNWNHYRICKEKNIWGVMDYLNDFDNMALCKKEDILIFYIKAPFDLKDRELKKGAYTGDVFKVTSEGYYTDFQQMGWDNTYQFRVNIELIEEIGHKKFYPVILQELGIVRTKSDIGPWLEGGMHLLTKKQFIQIYSTMKNSN